MLRDRGQHEADALPDGRAGDLDVEQIRVSRETIALLYRTAVAHGPRKDDLTDVFAVRGDVGARRRVDDGGIVPPVAELDRHRQDLRLLAQIERRAVTVSGLCQ